MSTNVEEEQNASPNIQNKVDSKAVKVFIARGIEFTYKCVEEKVPSLSFEPPEVRLTWLRTQRQYFTKEVEEYCTSTVFTLGLKTDIQNGLEKQIPANKNDPLRARVFNTCFSYMKFARIYLDGRLACIPDDRNRVLGELELEHVSTSGGTRTYAYPAKNNPKYEVTIVETREDFKKALETEDAHVIYQGHGREGRGPCFGSSMTGEEWEDDGLLRMGYPLVGVPIVEDILKHEYHIRPYNSADDPQKKVGHHPALEKAEVLPLIIDHKMSKKKEWDVVDTPTRHIEYHDPGGTLRGYLNGYSIASKLWGYIADFDPGPTLWLVVNAGWKDTDSKPWDLGSVNLKCKVFCNFGCSSEPHFKEILRGDKYKAWGKDKGTEGSVAVFTDKTSGVECAAVWLWALLKYGDPKKWNDSLKTVTAKANDRLTELSKKYARTWNGKGDLVGKYTIVLG